ncbi:MAG: glycosyltransferase family 9 protein [Prosthecobacter sp.]|uniref:glycosyltransferase family 9 protein n=1 Tax=Prosthecobacter sp. TaxID=1965333 RepID=UPI0019E9FD08|nr:glycosyltransferase family 9 protein [Prosthecobacter sp.]MBE2285084.1 glycosyltransferase family 9 protein [Prosthecobacter sp.]
MKTLAVYHKQLGDTLLLQPALARLARQDGEPVGLIARPGFEDLVRLMPDVKFTSWRDAPRVRRLLAYDAGDRSAFISLWCRADEKHLLTFSDFYVRFFHRWIFDRIHLRDQEQMYRARYFWRCTPGGDAESFEPPRLNAPPDDWLPAELPSEPYVLIHATSAWQRKCLSAECWRPIIERVKDVTGMPVVLTGGTTEWERGLCASIEEGLDGVTNLGARTSLRGVMAAASKATVALAVDGFVSHLVSAFGRPCMTFFGPTNVNHWHLTTPISRAVFPGIDPGAAKGRRIADLVPEELPVQVEDWLKQVAARA